MNTFEENNINPHELTETENKQHLIDDEKFLLLKQCQQHISKLTEFSPSLRKLINELITAENLETVKKKIMSIWNH